MLMNKINIKNTKRIIKNMKKVKRIIKNNKI